MEHSSQLTPHTNNPCGGLPPSFLSLLGIRYKEQALKYCRGTRVKMKKTCFKSVLTTMSNQCYGVVNAKKLPGLEDVMNKGHSNNCKWTWTVSQKESMERIETDRPDTSTRLAN